MHALERNFYSTLVMCMVKRNIINPEIRDVQSRVAKRTPLTILATQWVMMGGGRHSCCDITRHASSNAGHKSSLPSTARSSQMEERWDRSKTCTRRRIISKRCRKVMADLLSDALVGTAARKMANTDSWKGVDGVVIVAYGEGFCRGRRAAHSLLDTEEGGGTFATGWDGTVFVIYI